MKNLSSLNQNDNPLVNVSYPIDGGDAVNKDYVTDEKLALNRMSISNSYKRRVIHNLDYQHADAAAAYSLLGSVYPQTFVIDEVANEIMTISANPQVVSVFDWTTGAYKGRCFSLGRVGVCESATIRYEGSTRYLYVVGDRDEVARFDLTTLPANLTTISPANTYTVDAYHHIKYRHGRWIIFSNKQDSGSATGTDSMVNRGKFGLFDDNFNQIGMGELPTVLIGKRGSYLTEGGPPKIQSFDEGNGFIAVSIGAQWNQSIPKTTYRSHGIRLFTPNGEPIIDSLMDPEKLFNILTDEGYSPTLVENEGIFISNDKIYTLTTLNTSADVGPGDGGLLIMEEFSDHPDAIDFSSAATAYNAPDVRDVESGNHPVAYDGKLHDLMNWDVLDTVPKILTYMESSGQRRFAFYAKDATVKDIYGVNIPDNVYVEIRNVNNYTYLMDWTGTHHESFRIYDPANWKQARVTTSRYSTSEQDTGTRWIDNKTIYRKVINTGALPNNARKQVPHNITGIETIISIQGTAHSGTPGTVRPLPYPSDTLSNQIQVYANATMVDILTTSNLSVYSKSHVILEYTKS